MAIERHEFSSGLQIYVDHLPDSHTTNMNWIVHAGSLDESEEKAGMSHLVEHVVHQGSELFTDNQSRLDHAADNMYYSGANTGPDRTLYFARGVNEPEMIRGMGSIVLEPSLTDESVEHEVQVVTREAKMSLDDSLYQAYFAHAQAITDAPFSRPVIGYADALNFSGEEVREFYKDFYRLDNMQIALAGKITIDDAVKCFELTFPQVSAPASTDPGRYSPKVDRPTAKINQPNSFWFPNAHRKSNTVVNIGVLMDENTAHNIRDNADPSYGVAASLLSLEVAENLREKQRLSYDGSFTFSPQWDKSIWGMGAKVTVDPEKSELAHRTIYEGVAEAVTASDRKIDLARKQRITHHHMVSDGIDWRTGNITNSLEVFLPTHSVEEINSRLNDMTIDEIRSSTNELAEQFILNPHYDLYDGAPPHVEDALVVSAKLLKNE